MKLSKRAVEDLLGMIEHVREDISYGGGGTYNRHDDDHSFDQKAARGSERAIEVLKRLILIHR